MRVCILYSLIFSLLAVGFVMSGAVLQREADLSDLAGRRR